MKNVERRSVTENVEVRDEGGAAKIVGYAAVFNSFSQDLGGFIEIIRPGSFERAIKEDDVRALWNHDANFVLGRRAAGTLRLFEDQRGLRYEIDVPDTSFGRDLLVSIRRGDVSGSSFAFSVRSGGERWRREDAQQVRELIDLELSDVSPVTYPAYLATEVALRSLDAHLAAERRPDRSPRLLDLRLRLAESDGR